MTASRQIFRHGLLSQLSPRALSSLGRCLAVALLATMLGSVSAVLGPIWTAAHAGAQVSDPMPAWTQLSPATSPPGLSDAASAYDPATGQLILFGGLGGTNSTTGLGTTWDWNGTSWTQLSPATSPSPRFWASLAYDSATSQLVLFGGAGANGFNDDTWSWNGTNWTEEETSPNPTAREGASMAFDPATSQLILFGGWNGSSLLSTTWAWNGSNWAKLSPSTSPPARFLAPMAFDTASNELVLYGGGGTSSILSDVWTWSGNQWTELATEPTADQDFAGSLVFDPETTDLFLYGGYDNASPGGFLSGIWALTDSSLDQLSITAPPSRANATMVYDSQTSQVVLFGGSPSTGKPSDSTWVYGYASGSSYNWTHLSASGPVLALAASAYEPSNGELVVYGGVSSVAHDALTDNTWEWNGTSWTQLHPATSPPHLFGATMAYDPVDGADVLFGGLSTGELSLENETWAFSGSGNGSWRELATTGPLGRTGTQMAYDPTTGELLLFGGASVVDTKNTTLNDTWEWNGTSWTQLHPSTSPPACSEQSMAYDPATHQVVLLDGSLLSGSSTWTWTGSTWSKVSTSVQPPDLPTYPAMAYDPAMGDLLLFGGGTQTIAKNDSYAWTGSNWVAVTTASTPPARWGAVMAYDARTGQLVLHGGGERTTTLSDTWVDQVIPTATSTSLAAPSKVAVGQSVTLSATVSSAAATVPPTTTPTGTVNFSETIGGQTTTVASHVALNPSGMAQAVVPLSTIGTESFTATYSGDNGHSPSTSPAATISVGTPATITSAASTTFTVGRAGSYQVSAGGSGTFSYSLTGAPSWLSIGSATGVMAGTPPAGTGGIDDFTVVASNGYGSPAVQPFALTIDQSPAITSPNQATFTVGTSEDLPLTASGYPAPTWSETGPLPSGISLLASGSLVGTPATGTGGKYELTLTAANGVGTPATQSFTLIVNEAPAITSAASTTFVAGEPGTFTFASKAYPPPIYDELGVLPAGVTLSLTGVLSGTPAADTGGSYPIVVAAANGIGPAALQAFVLNVDAPPDITSGPTAAFAVGVSEKVDLTSTGYPAPAFSETGTLPHGLKLTSKGVLQGTPAAGSQGTYDITLRASNGIGTPATQDFVVVVEGPAEFLNPSTATFTVGQLGTFPISTSGFLKTPVISKTGTLSAGLHFTNNKNGTAKVAGTPTGKPGSFIITLVASTSEQRATQTLTIVVVRS